MKQSAYQTLVEFAQKVDLPKAYTDDLYKHDRNTLAEYDGPFVWVVRDNGTHLFKLEPITHEVRWKVREYIKNIAHIFTGDKNKWYALWTGKDLHISSSAQTLLPLVDEFLVRRLNSC